MGFLQDIRNLEQQAADSQKAQHLRAEGRVATTIIALGDTGKTTVDDLAVELDGEASQIG
jgi:hypothetical protein